MYSRLRQVCDTPPHMLLMRSDPSASSSGSANTGSSKGKRKHAGDKNSDSPKRLALSVNETQNSSSFSASDSLLSASRSTRSRNSLVFFGSSPEPSPGPASSLHHHALHNNHMHHQSYHHAHFPHAHHTTHSGHAHVVTNAYAPHQPSLLHPHLHMPTSSMPTPPSLHQPSPSQAPPLSFMGSAGDIHSLLLHPVNTLAGDSLFGDLPVPSDSFADTIGLSQLDLESPNGDGHGVKPLSWPSSDDIMNDPNVYNLIVNLAP